MRLRYVDHTGIACAFTVYHGWTIDYPTSDGGFVVVKDLKDVVVFMTPSWRVIEVK